MTDPVRLSDRLKGPLQETGGIQDGTTTVGDEKGAGQDHCGREREGTGYRDGIGRGGERGRIYANKTRCAPRPSCPPRTPPNSVSLSPTLRPLSNALLISSVSISNLPSTRPLRPARAAQMNIVQAQATPIEIRGLAVPPTLRNKPMPWTALLAPVHPTPSRQLHPILHFPTTPTPRPRRQQRAIHRRQRMIQFFLPL